MQIVNDGVELAFEVTGDGPPVVLLHGFPDTGAMWRPQADALAAAGFRAVVPDLRGYGASGKPERVEEYSMLHVAGDVLAMLDHLGIERAHVVGHDWGAALAWVMGSMLPDRVDHLVALSVGHPLAFRDAGIEQLEKSWYMLLFQFEGTAEQWLTADGWANFTAWCNHPEGDAVITTLESNGSLTPALNWYRANIPPEALAGPPPDFPAVAAPTMGVWSSSDFALTERQMTGSSEYVAGPWRYERIEGVGHWIPIEAPDEVSRLLLDFFPSPG